MKTRGAVIIKAPGKYEVVEIELDEPRQGEILVEDGRLRASATPTTTSPPATCPSACTRCAAATRARAWSRRSGPTPAAIEVGDHVVFSFLPGCGRCRWCASGMQNLCDLGAGTARGAAFDDPTSFRMHLEDGANVGQMCGHRHASPSTPP